MTHILHKATPLETQTLSFNGAKSMVKVYRHVKGLFWHSVIVFRQMNVDEYPGV